MTIISRFILLLLAISACMPAVAEQMYGFNNIALSYLDWTDKAENRVQRSPFSGLQDGIERKNDFAYIELEAGAGFDWGNLYGFADFENPFAGTGTAQAPADGFRIAAKGVVTVNVAEQSQWNYYGHLYSITDSADGNGFFEQNIVLGLSYEVRASNLYWEPFLGAHYAVNNYDFSEWNGYMAGWTLMYDFNLAAQSFTLSQWHETEFLRHERYGKDNKVHQNNTGQNGALAMWWNAAKSVQVGLQYRYADHKLGTPDYIDALIYTVKYRR